MTNIKNWVKRKNFWMAGNIQTCLSMPRTSSNQALAKKIPVKPTKRVTVDKMTELFQTHDDIRLHYSVSS